MDTHINLIKFTLIWTIRPDVKREIRRNLQLVISDLHEQEVRMELEAKLAFRPERVFPFS